MGTEIFGFGQLGAEIIGFKEDWGPESISGPIESLKVGYVSLNSIFSAIFCDNRKVSVYIGKLMTRGFQNTPYTCISLKIEGPRALQNKAKFY